MAFGRFKLIHVRVTDDSNRIKLPIQTLGALIERPNGNRLFRFNKEVAISAFRFLRPVDRQKIRDHITQIKATELDTPFQFTINSARLKYLKDKTLKLGFSRWRNVPMRDMIKSLIEYGVVGNE
jgi:hypothetical protein